MAEVQERSSPFQERNKVLEHNKRLNAVAPLPGMALFAATRQNGHPLTRRYA